MCQTARKSNRGGLFSWLKHVSIEPTLFLFRFTHCVAEIVQKNLYLQKACRVNCTSEPDLTTPCDDTEKGVRFVAFVGSNVSSIGTFVVVFLCIIYASYSDKIGKRKPFILLPCVGLVVNSVLGCVHSYWWSLPPIYAALAEAICHTVFGAFHTFIMFSQIYISNVTTTENRTARMGFLMVIKLLAVSAGSGAAGYFVNWFGFLGSYILCLVLSLLTLFTAVALIRETPVQVEENGSKKFAPISGILTSCKTIFGRRRGKQRVIVALLLLNLNLLLFAHEGEFSNL